MIRTVRGDVSVAGEGYFGVQPVRSDMPCCRQDDKHAKRGASIGASVGAVLGSPLGPVGAGIGAGFGGASGYLAGTARDKLGP